MQQCRRCPFPIFEDWHCMVVTANGHTYHRFCFYDENQVTPQDRLSVPRIPRSRIQLP